MQISYNNFLKKLIVIVCIGFLSIVFWGCTNVRQQEKLNENYLPKDGVVIKVAKVVNDTGFTFDFDIEKMLADALEEQLFEKDLLWLGDKEPNIFMESTIIGSSSKQPLTPKAGPDELLIRCKLKDDKDNPVGSIIVRREQVMKDLKNVAGWQAAINSAANDVAEDIRSQIESHGYAVRPKTLPKKTADKPVATFSPAKINPTEPWTGVWDVQGSVHCSGRWRMIQTGNHVDSTKDSVYEIKGKTRGNQLKGRMSSSTSTSQFNSFVINISPDGQSFDGICDLPWQKNLPIKGKRITGSTVTTFPSSQIDHTQPWTGIWELTYWWGGGHKFVLKQDGKKVKSTDDSCCEFSGTIEGNTLRGWIILFDKKQRKNCSLKISADNNTFNGSFNAPGWSPQTTHLRGKRTTASTVATFSSSQIDPTAPWSGIWKVEGSRLISGTWGMKQRGRIVKSTKDSYYEFEGKVRGNQLKGKVVGDYNITHKLVLNLSSDGQSFEGTSISGFNNTTKKIRGRRQK